MIVAEASVLIVLAKVRRLELLKQVYDSFFVGPTVRHEVVDEGRRVGALGVQLVEQALADGWLCEGELSPQERRMAARLQKETRLDKGEIEALSVAWHRGYLILVDDKEARVAAESLGVEYMGTMGMLLEAYRDGHLSLVALEDAVSDVSRVLWLSPTVVATVLRRAREAGR